MAASKTKERTRYGQLPVPAERATLHWGLEETNVTDGELVRLLMDTPEFQDVVGPRLEKIDERAHAKTSRGTKLGTKTRWSAMQLESVFLFRRVAGFETVKRAWVELKADPQTRLMLGLGDELPSRASLTRHLKSLSQIERAGLYREVDRRLRQRVVQLPGFDEEARILGMDGSKHGTHYMPPIYELDEEGGKTGRIVNEKSVTAETAGYIGGFHAKSGQGWQMLALFTERGTLLAWDISALNESEMPAAERVLASYEKEVHPFRKNEKPSVLSADGGFNSHKIRRQAQALCIVPNIHKASHKEVPGLPEQETENAAKRNKRWWTFAHPKQAHYSNWQCNGHGELRCSCGKGKTKRVNEIRANTNLTIAVKGACSNCGNVRITSGRWSKARRPDRYVPAYRGDEADLTIGNSLTFNDPLAAIYGAGRFGWGESVHATINKRFGLLKDKSWMRDISEVEAEFAVAASAISVLLLERHARQAAQTPIGNSPTSSGTSTAPVGASQPALPLAA
jgi:hypothetical protein